MHRADSYSEVSNLNNKLIESALFYGAHRLRGVVLVPDF